MALNMDALGKPLGPFTRHYTWKDAVLYALGVGAGFDELQYCYEKDLKVIPSFAIAAVFEFLAHAGMASNVNLAGILHGEQELIFHRPIPPEGTLVTRGMITHYYDKGPDKGALVIAESHTCDGAGRNLFTGVATLFSRLDGGFGGKNAPKTDAGFPDRSPDITVTARPSNDQPLIYRLSGDIFQLHVDPEFAKMAGFEKPIMHGLCTHGYACRALIRSLIPGAPDKVRRIRCRFARPLYPGTPIETRIWKTAEGQAMWRTVNAETGEDIITNGIFEYGDQPRHEIRFDKRVAIVTGAGSGLGRIYALELARRGARVLVNDLGGARDGSGTGSATPADQVAAEIRAMGGQAVASYDNVADPQGGENIVKTALSTFGTVDILINNAGILRDKSLIKMTPENWNAVVAVHLNGAFHVTRPAFAVMKEKGYGRIILTTSAAGLYGNFGQSNYAAAKMALVGFMNALKLEARKHNIMVNTVAPLAASRLTQDVLPPDLFERMKPEYVAPMVLYLASDICGETGRIYNAGMGCFSRAAILTGPGIRIGEDGHPPIPEDIHLNWDRINSLANAAETEDLNAALAAFMAASPPAP